MFSVDNLMLQIIYNIKYVYLREMLFVYSLTCGDVEGQLSALFNRVQTIQKKTGQFDVRLKILILKCL